MCPLRGKLGGKGLKSTTWDVEQGDQELTTSMKYMK